MQFLTTDQQRQSTVGRFLKYLYIPRNVVFFYKLMFAGRHDVKAEIKQEIIESPPEPPNKKYKWCFQSSKHSGLFYWHCQQSALFWKYTLKSYRDFCCSVSFHKPPTKKQTLLLPLGGLLMWKNGCQKFHWKTSSSANLKNNAAKLRQSYIGTMAYVCISDIWKQNLCIGMQKV